MTIVKFIGALRHISGEKEIIIDINKVISVKELLNKILMQVPQFKHTFCDNELNESKSNSLILLNGREISALKGYETEVYNKDEVVLIPVIHGG